MKRSTSLLAAILMAARQMYLGPADLPPAQPRRLKESRGRGNQGQWARQHGTFYTLPEHRDWNAAVDRKKRERHMRRLHRDSLLRGDPI